MAGGSTSTRADASSSFEAMCEDVVKCLKAPGFEMVGVHGWDGVGRRRVLRRAVEMLVGGGGDGVGTTLTSSYSSDPPLLFTHILRLSKQEDDTEIGRRVREMLQSERNEAGEPFEEWWVPLTLPQHATLIIIEQDLNREIDKYVVFGYELRYDWHVKIVVSIGPDRSSSPVNTYRYKIFSNSFTNLAEEEAWELLRHEADEIAEELCREQQQLFFTGEAIMECLLYTTIIKSEWDFFPIYLWCEGLVVPSSTTAASSATSSSTSTTTTPTTSTIEYLTIMCNLLVTKFQQRSMLESSGGLQSTVRTIATTPYQSPPSIIRKKGQFMVAIGEGLKELPEGILEQWDRQGITRVSLYCNKIEQLQYPPAGSSRHSPPKCENLSTLILTGNPLSRGIQDDFFFQGMIMPNLRVLDLSFSPGLQVLPTSLTCLTNLRFLNLQNCSRLHTISPCLDRGFPNLEILVIPDCPLPGMTTASFQQVPNLRLLDTKNSLLNLEVLDLSGTKIESLPTLKDTNKDKIFTRLDLINTKHLSNIDWQDFTRIPTTINCDQCGGCCTRTPHSDTIGHLRMCVQDVAIFRSLKKDHQLWSRCFQEFHIHVHPCTNKVQVLQQQDPHSAYRPAAPDDHQYSHHHHHHHQTHRKCPSSTPYKNLNLIPERKHGHHHRYSNNYDPPRNNWRYLHICGVSTLFTLPLEGVLPNMHSLQLCNHDSVKLLLLVHPMELRTCQVAKCPNMEMVFFGRPTSELAYLESINLFQLISLKTLYGGNFGPTGSFASLRSLYVDNCPRMVTVFSSTPRSILLPQLRELVIRSCGKLIEVFGRGAVGSTVAPALSYLHLWDLPELRNVCDGCLPSLRTLQLRGCAKLRALPLPPVDSEGKPFKLDIIAEQKWWENLDVANKKCIVFKPWSPWGTSRS